MHREKEIKIDVKRVEAEGVKNSIEEDIKNAEGSTVWKKAGKFLMYVLVGLLPIFFLPWTTSPVDINKQALTGFLILSALICYLADALERKKLIYPRSHLSAAVITFFAAAVLSAVFSVSLNSSLGLNFSFPDSILAFAIYILAFLLASIFFGKEDIKRLSLVIISSIALAVLSGTLQLFGKFILPFSFTKQVGFELIGPLYGVGIFAGFGLAFVATRKMERNINPFDTLRIDSERRRRVKNIIFYILGILFLIGLLILNYTLLWVILALTMFGLGFLRFSSGKSFTVPLALASLAVFLIVIGGEIPSISRAPFLEIRPNFTTTLSVVKDTILGKRLLLGSGPATFLYDFALYKPPSINNTGFWNINFSQGHNFLTTSLANLGILPSLLFLAIIFYFLTRALKLKDEDSLSPIIAGVGFLTISLFFYPAFFLQLVFIFLGLGLLESSSGRLKEISLLGGSTAKSFLLSAVMIIILSGTAGGIYLVGKRYAGAVVYARGLEVSGLDVDKTLNLFLRAVNLNPQSDRFFRSLSQAFLVKAQNTLQSGLSGENQIIFQNYVASSINAAIKAKDLNSADSVNWGNLGSIYENLIGLALNAENFALDSYQQAISRDPKNPEVFANIARTKILSGDLARQRNDLQAQKQSYEEALKSLNDSLGLKSDYAQARFLLAQIYIREGNLAQAIEETKNLQAINPNDAGVAFQLGLLYYQGGMFNEAQGEFERAVVISENYSNARYFLGLIYDRKGENQKALEQFENIEKFNPDNQEVKRILANLKSGRAALEGIVPPAAPPEKRGEAPVSEKKQE